MAVAKEFNQAVGRTGKFHPAMAVSFGKPDTKAGLNSMRRRVNAGLCETLDMQAGVCCLHVLSAPDDRIEAASFDIVTADFELSHLAEPQQTAEGLLRICRPGGRIGIASPAPRSFLAEVHDRIALYAGGDAGAKYAGFKGDREALDGLFGQHAIALGARDLAVRLDFPSPEHWLAEWRRSYAPLRAAYHQTPIEWRSQFTNDLLAIVTLFAEPHQDRLSIRCDYIEFIVHKGDSL